MKLSNKVKAIHYNWSFSYQSGETFSVYEVGKKFVKEIKLYYQNSGYQKFYNTAGEVVAMYNLAELDESYDHGALLYAKIIFYNEIKNTNYHKIIFNINEIIFYEN